MARLAEYRAVHPASVCRLAALPEHQQARKAASHLAEEGAQVRGLDLPGLARDRADLAEEWLALRSQG